MNLIIRNENINDYRTVEELTREAFWDVHVPGCCEHYVLHNLRNNPDFLPELTFVAEKAGRIVGHIAYSRGTIQGKRGKQTSVVSFGPVSVLPAYQKQGIGSALIKLTTNMARASGYPAVCIYGNPKYYSRFGFRCAEKYEIKTVGDKYAVALQVLELRPQGLRNVSGKFIESAAFEVDEKKFAKFDAAFPHKEKSERESQQEFRIICSLMY
jgi:predicted N-acetyltransferase YhbS